MVWGHRRHLGLGTNQGISQAARLERNGEGTGSGGWVVMKRERINHYEGLEREENVSVRGPRSLWGNREECRLSGLACSLG